MYSSVHSMLTMIILMAEGFVSQLLSAHCCCCLLLLFCCCLLLLLFFSINLKALGNRPFGPWASSAECGIHMLEKEIKVSGQKGIID